MQGYQAGDAVVQRRGARALIVQTFDFGTAGRMFGRSTAAPEPVGGTGGGDGGQVLMLVDGW